MPLAADAAAAERQSTMKVVDGHGQWRERERGKREEDKAKENDAAAAGGGTLPLSHSALFYFYSFFLSFSSNDATVCEKSVFPSFSSPSLFDASACTRVVVVVAVVGNFNVTLTITLLTNYLLPLLLFRLHWLLLLFQSVGNLRARLWIVICLSV